MAKKYKYKTCPKCQQKLFLCCLEFEFDPGCEWLHVEGKNGCDYEEHDEHWTQTIMDEREEAAYQSYQGEL